MKKQQVAAIRTLEDARKIERMIPKNGHAVVIGGGVLGLEAAWELKKGRMWCHRSGSGSGSDGKTVR